MLAVAAFSLAATASSNNFAKDESVTFENVSALLGPYTRSTTGGGLGGIAWLDYDQDGDLDLYVTNSAFADNGLFRNNGDGTFTNVSTMAGVTNRLGNLGVVIGDIDNDGAGHFSENEHNVTSVDLSSKCTSGPAQADFDGDSFIDMAVMTAPYQAGPITVPSEDFVLLRNLGNENNWLTIRLVGTQSNRDGVGAVIKAKLAAIHKCV